MPYLLLLLYGIGMVTITAFYCIARGLSSMKADKFSGGETPEVAGKCV
ncbi:MAG: hypothetical protein IKO14_02715 [Oscillibacter sp.]|nr:hypothetical protein [Oscillibacter sp.]